LDLDSPVGEATTALAPAGESAVATAGEPQDAVLVDDDFAYLPAVARAVAVPGSQIVPPGLRRFRVDVQYKGEHFFGWDRAALLRARDHERNANAGNTAGSSSSSSGARSARDAVEEALKAALDVAAVEVVPSCILESGVHARRLVCHVDLPAALEMQPRTVLQRAHLWLQQAHDPLAVLSFRPAPPDFHALHSCRRRVFVCRMLNRVAPPLFDLGSQWHLDRPLDVDRMNEACELLRGRRDFTAFADPRTHAALRRSSDGGVRTVDRLQVVRQDDEVLLWCAGRSLLRGQLRCMAGVLRMVGQGLWDEAALEHFVAGGFATRDLGAPRGRLQPPLAPAHSIALWASEYDTDTPEVLQPVQSGPIEL
jgi:tRNA pseudouridine(38-40) synthase